MYIYVILLGLVVITVRYHTYIISLAKLLSFAVKMYFSPTIIKYKAMFTGVAIPKKINNTYKLSFLINGVTYYMLLKRNIPVLSASSNDIDVLSIINKWTSFSQKIPRLEDLSINSDADIISPSGESITIKPTELLKFD